MDSGGDAERVLADLRKAGWAVAVHNDYRQDGQARTFWLLTHPCGRWVKGEGASDAAALEQCELEAARALSERRAATVDAFWAHMGAGEKPELVQAIEAFHAVFMPEGDAYTADQWAAADRLERALATVGSP